MRLIRRDTIFWPSKSIRHSVLFVFVISFLFSASVGAAWKGPTAQPPMGNVSPPLNEDTSFLGDVSGKYNTLKLTITNCQDGQSLMFKNGAYTCGNPTSTAGLLTVLNNDADASAFTGSTIIGGELKADWLHTTQTGWNTFMGNVSIGNSNLNGYLNPLSAGDTGGHRLFVYSAIQAESAEIDLKTGDATGGHWSILNFNQMEGGVLKDELRVWNGGAYQFGIDKTGNAYATNNMYAKDFCRYGGQCLDDIISGIGVKFIGLTDITYNGDRGGYSSINNICGAGNHVCTSNDMLIISRNSTVFTGISDKYAWISTGVAGFKEDYLINDCNGWNSNSVDAYGSIWKIKDETTGGSVWITQCKNLNKIACCK